MSRMIVTQAGSYMVPVCPSWCQLPADHDLDEEACRNWDGSVVRIHERGEVTIACRMNGLAGPIVVRIAAGESVPDQAEPDEPTVVLTGGTEILTSAEARRLAAALLNGADELDAITGAAS